MAKILTAGSNYLGVVPEFSSQELGAAVTTARVVLPKGQANYELWKERLLPLIKLFFCCRPSVR